MADDNIRKTRKSASQVTTGDAAISSAKTTSNVQTPPAKETKEKTGSNELQKIGDKIIAKMVNEGQLVRNTGTNSLKSIGDKLIKFDAVFKSINMEMQVQTSALKNIHNELMNEHDDNKRRIEQARTKTSEEEEERKNSDKSPKGGGKKGKPDKSSSSQGIVGLVDKMLGGPIGMLMTIPIRAIGAVMGGITGNVVSDYILGTAENLGIEKQYLDAIAAPLKGGLIWGGIGMAISKKMGVFGLVAGAAWPLADQLLNAAGFDPKQTLMGLEIGDIFAAIMSGSFMYLLKKNFNPMSIMRMVGEEAESGKNGNKGALPKSTKAKIAGIIGRSKFALVAAINLGFEALEDPLISYLENNAGIDAEDSQSVINWTQMGMSIGAMFGPYGLIAGAAIGLTIGLGTTIYKWLNDAERTTKKRVEKAAEILDKVRNNPNEVLSKNEIKELEDSREHFINNNTRPDLVQEVDSVIKNQEKLTGKSIVSREDRVALDQTVDQNRDDIRGKLLEITKLPVADQAKAYDDYVGELQKQNPELNEKYISNVVREEFGNSKWYNGGRLLNSERADISDMYTNITPNSNVIQSVNYTNDGKHVSSLFDEVVMPEFQKKFAKRDKDGNIIEEAVFDPNDYEIQKWIESNPKVRSAMNQIYAAALEDRGVKSSYKNQNGDMENYDVVGYMYSDAGALLDSSATGSATEEALDFVKKSNISQVAVGPQTIIIQGGDTTNINSSTVAGSNNNTQSHNVHLRGGNGRVYGTGGVSRPN